MWCGIRPEFGGRTSRGQLSTSLHRTSVSPSHKWGQMGLQTDSHVPSAQARRKSQMLGARPPGSQADTGPCEVSSNRTVEMSRNHRSPTPWGQAGRAWAPKQEHGVPLGCLQKRLHPQEGRSGPFAGELETQICMYHLLMFMSLVKNSNFLKPMLS